MAHAKLTFCGPAISHTTLGAAGLLADEASSVGGYVAIRLDVTDRVLRHGNTKRTGLAGAWILA